MRKVLFRGKDIHGKWHYGDYLEESKSGKYPALEPMHYIAKKVCRGELPELKWIIPETRGEFTGLTDKNGTKIFEGDILKWKHSILEVVYIDDGYYARNLYEIDALGDFLETPCAEVIGNIHDNPELLNEMEELQ